MSQWVRFVVSKNDVLANRSNPGLFVAAQHLLDRAILERHEREQLTDLMEWFRMNLPVPPSFHISTQAIYWYRPCAEEIISKMWELVHILNEYDYNVTVITASFVGRIVYEDAFQVAAIPHKDRFA